MLSTTKLIEQDLNQRMSKQTPLTLAQFDALVAIDRAGAEGLTMTDLSRSLLVSNANSTGMVGRLAEKGWVVKKTSRKDRRVQTVTLSSKGRDILHEAIGYHKIWVDEIFDILSEEEADLAIRLMDKLRKDL
mgnify:CR=1 FL=1|tara:strand:+ start:2733 stop:3128 length:396 start_codon:yes stop_codon:yes gene_type:complete